MPPEETPGIRARLNSYTGYSISCGIVWAVILAVGQRRLDTQARNTLRQACAAWWSGWTSATIARVAYPAPKGLSSRGRKRLQNASLVLIAIGLVNVIRVLVAGKLPGRATESS
jgi:hypothetical protein